MESYLRVNLLGRGPRLMKKDLPGRGLTKVEKHSFRISGHMNADRRTQHAEHCVMERGDVCYDWAASGNIQRSML